MVTLPLSLPPSVGSVGVPELTPCSPEQVPTLASGMMRCDMDGPTLAGELPHTDASILRAGVQNFVTNLSYSSLSRPPLKPLQPWMLEGDLRSDAEADAD
jgi:hypothetical protein